jgi:hypothetical protein
VPLSEKRCLIIGLSIIAMGDVLFPLTQNFIGRTQDLAWLDHETSGREHRYGFSPIVVTGLGGIGKSTLVRESSIARQPDGLMDAGSIRRSCKRQSEISVMVCIQSRLCDSGRRFL